MQNFFDKEESSRMGKLLSLLVFVVILYFGMKFINQIKTYGMIGVSPKEATTIDVAGEGISYALPDVATISFNVEAKGKTVAVAQDIVNTRVNTAMEFLAQSNIDKKDIQTVNYNSYPEYSNPCVGNYGVVCPSKPGTPTILEYDVTQAVTIKVRDLTAASKVIDGLGVIGVSAISGPDFSVDNPDTVKSDAKQKAIDDAKQKAIALASQLGMHLGKIVHFNDQSNPMPIMYAAKAETAGAASGVASDSTNLPSGQNKYVSDVTITYEVY